MPKEHLIDGCTHENQTNTSPKYEETNANNDLFKTRFVIRLTGKLEKCQSLLLQRQHTEQGGTMTSICIDTMMKRSAAIEGVRRLAH